MGSGWQDKNIIENFWIQLAELVLMNEGSVS